MVVNEILGRLNQLIATGMEGGVVKNPQGLLEVILTSTQPVAFSNNPSEPAP